MCVRTHGPGVNAQRQLRLGAVDALERDLRASPPYQDRPGGHHTPHVEILHVQR